MTPHEATQHIANGRLRVDPQRSWELFHRAWPLLERFVVLRLAGGGLSGDRLGDCAQNAFVRMWAHRRSYRGGSEGEFWKWITRICDNERQRFTWRAARRESVEAPAARLDPASDPATEAAPVGQDVEHDDTLIALRACMQTLGPLERRIIEIMYIHPALSERAAAELLDLSPATVHKIKVQALAALGECLRARGIAE